jgi:hypothetical protein
MPAQVDALTLADAAQRAQVSPTTWKAHRAAGAPRPRTAKKRDVDAWLVEYAGWRQQQGKVDSRTAATGDGAATPDSIRWSVEWKRLRVESMRLDLAERAGLLVKRSEVVEFAGKACATVRAQLESMISRLPSQLATLQTIDDIEERLRAEVEAILDALAQGLEPPQGRSDGSAAHA